MSDALLVRLPMYASGVLLAVGLAVWASTDHWSGLRLVLVGTAVAAFYTVFVLVPLLIHLDLTRRRS